MMDARAYPSRGTFAIFADDEAHYGQDNLGRAVETRQNGKAIRANAPHPETKEPSLPQAAIARWPHDGLNINLGFLGQSPDPEPPSPNQMTLRGPQISHFL
jgi:hypothetical protein